MLDQHPKWQPHLAPEYILFGKVNEKVDVYAFGVVLLKLQVLYFVGNTSHLAL